MPPAPFVARSGSQLHAPTRLQRAQVSRSSQQTQLRRFLTGYVVVPLGKKDAHAAGRLLTKTKTSELGDVVVLTVALSHRAVIMTGDVDDIERLLRASGHRALVVPV